MSSDLDPRNNAEGQPQAGVLNREVHYQGDTIIHQGEEGYRAYYIEKGLVAIIIKEDGRELKIAELGAGDLFGEMALINKEPRSASVRALTETVVTTISRDEVEGRIKRIEDKAIHALINVLARRLRNTTQGQMEHFKNTSTFLDRITEMVDRMVEDVDESKREKFRADITPLLEDLQKILDRYQR